MKVLSEKEISNLSLSERKKYYQDLKDYCLSFKANPNISIGQKLISKISPIFILLESSIYASIFSSQYNSSFLLFIIFSTIHL